MDPVLLVLIFFSLAAVLAIGFVGWLIVKITALTFWLIALPFRLVLGRPLNGRGETNRWRRCTTCAKESPPHAMFCRACGRRLRNTPPGRRQRVTVRQQYELPPGRG
jgi:hypothetical protein